MTLLHVVLPGDIDDPTTPSGGNVYDRRLCDGLTDLGWTVAEHCVAGGWPRPGADSLRRLADVVADLPGGAVVLVDGLVASAAAGVLVPSAQRLRLVVLVHQPLGLAVPSAADPAEVAASEREVLAASAVVLTTSEWTRRWLVAEYGLDPRRIRVACPGVDRAAPASRTPAGRRLLCVAALTPAKGHDVLLSALAGVADLDWECRVVGSRTRDADHAAHVARRVDELGLGDRVRLVGPLVGPDLDDAYAAADLLVHASLAETFGMVLTEALARGVPVVAAGAGGVAEAFGAAPDGSRPGLLVPAGDDAALAAALRSWLTDADLRRRLRHSADLRRPGLAGWDQTAAAVAVALG